MGKTLLKRNFRQISFDLGTLELLKILRTLQNFTEFVSNLHGKYSILFLICANLKVNSKCRGNHLKEVGYGGGSSWSSKKEKQK